MERAAKAVFAALLATIFGGCNLALGIDKDYVVGDHGGAGGAGGAGVEGASASDDASTGGASSGACAGMVDVGSFCIDAKEVTNAEYAAWLATSPKVTGQPAACAWNDDFTPASGWPAQGGGEPVVYVDWCDARAYCAAAGKRLCGRKGGGDLAFDEALDDARSEWTYACTGGGAVDYPYGAAYGGSICDGKDYTHPNRPIAVGSAADCHGTSAPYNAIFDLSGNVAEWEDACAGSSGAGDLCRRRGGSWKNGAKGLRCDADASLGRAAADGATGFRCCAD